MIFATLLITPNLTFGHLSSGNTAASCQRGVGNAKLASRDLIRNLIKKDCWRFAEDLLFDFPGTAWQALKMRLEEIRKVCQENGDI